ncbi:hypothetical protein FACS1894122_02360 [Alphaproteobacteria bacterium]|nr:hypothetical protein FACS1894122_02360 [Alphaproteobacteria bacterium]
MLHRIDYIDPARIYYNERLKISPDYLEDLLKYAKFLGCSFVSLDELHEIIKSVLIGFSFFWIPTPLCGSG